MPLVNNTSPQTQNLVSTTASIGGSLQLTNSYIRNNGVGSLSIGATQAGTTTLFVENQSSGQVCNLAVSGQAFLNGGVQVSSIVSPGGNGLLFLPSNGSISFYSGGATTVSFASAQSGQTVAATFVTAEGKNAGFSHSDVASGLGRLFDIYSQSAVPITFSPSATELLRLNGFGGSVATSTANWTVTAPSATSTPLKLKGAASQQNNLLELQNNSATVLLAVQANGRLYFNSTDTPPVNTTTPTAWLDVTVGGSAYKLPLYQ